MAYIAAATSFPQSAMSVYDFNKLTQLKICCYNQKLQPYKNAMSYFTI